MASAQDIRDELLETLKHIRGVHTKLGGATGNARTFSFADQHKLAEGLLLSAWTYWEQFLRRLMVCDVAHDPGGIVRKTARVLRSAAAAERLSQLLLDHPDERRFVEWSSAADVVSRAEQFLNPTHRFAVLRLHKADLELIQRIRNAIAHKSDRAWSSFRSLVSGPPFALQAKQLKGITPGRFLVAHRWNNSSVLEQALTILETAARGLVP